MRNGLNGRGQANPNFYSKELSTKNIYDYSFFALTAQLAQQNGEQCIFLYTNKNKIGFVLKDAPPLEQVVSIGHE